MYIPKGESWQNFLTKIMEGERVTLYQESEGEGGGGGGEVSIHVENELT